MRKLLVILVLAGIASLAACEKGWLEAKPDKALIVPVSIEDYQYLLNDRSVFGVRAPMKGELAADDLYLTSEVWLSLDALARNSYIWAEDMFGETLDEDWDWQLGYERIMQANIVLEGIEKIVPNATNQDEWNAVKGQALFHRALSYFDLSQVFCKAYDPATATIDLGLPLKVVPDVNDRVGRSTLQQTYDLIIEDLLLARQLLPETQEYKTMPTKRAVSGLLARIYLSIENYDAALKNANECLKANGDLLDYNELDSSVVFPMPLFNSEVIWHGELAGNKGHLNRDGFVDTMLYASYSESDLRKRLFFTDGADGVHFRGTYNGTRSPVFCGLANDEMYLIKAECLVRSKQIEAGMDMLNTLLRKRWRINEDGTSTYIDKAAATETEALQIILKERRKELIMRNVRWSDLRRLNKDERFAITLTRVVEGKTYVLPPGDLRYTFPLPPNEIRLNHVEQNPR